MITRKIFKISNLFTKNIENFARAAVPRVCVGEPSVQHVELGVGVVQGGVEGGVLVQRTPLEAGVAERALAS